MTDIRKERICDLFGSVEHFKNKVEDFVRRLKKVKEEILQKGHIDADYKAVMQTVGEEYQRMIFEYHDLNDRLDHISLGDSSYKIQEEDTHKFNDQKSRLKEDHSKLVNYYEQFKNEMAMIRRGE